MIKIDKINVYGWDTAIRGMRNPLNSWAKSDSGYGCGELKCGYCGLVDCPAWNRRYIVGENDLSLMKKLVKSGPDHSKFMRQIIVSMDITAPLYWWKEFDTYKVGTVANSCSTMHKIHAKEFTKDDFSCEHLLTGSMFQLHRTIDLLNEAREAYLECTVSKYGTAEEAQIFKKTYWWQMIQLLPSSYNQLRTVTLNYAVARNMYHARKNHKLDEWHVLCDAIRTLPYAEDLICDG